MVAYRDAPSPIMSADDQLDRRISAAYLKGGAACLARKPPPGVGLTHVVINENHPHMFRQLNTNVKLLAAVPAWEVATKTVTISGKLLPSPPQNRLGDDLL